MNVYLLKIALCGVSPMVWRRLRVPGNTTLATLHDAIQILNGWDNFYLHQFHIYGKDYAASDRAWMTNFHGANVLTLDDFQFDVGDKFTYEYNFFEHYLHEIRIERISASSSSKNTLFCVSGSGMPDATKHDVIELELKMIKTLVKKKGKLTVRDIAEFREDLDEVKFNRKRVNADLAATFTK